ncbi:MULTISPECIES: uroporphyrinogen-III C-methyltransferase [Bacillaceae]|uniref:uroporphyrinogen-III C-methyltransferase n=1 Tax=Bacillaceae TaxID=186817 RepID=UPI001E3B011A|nr:MULTISPECIES: uroporphyrinogen-III C-methyltransferase [Bacillaceae]MCE4050094.1 uroporphyrinogen-III C-methyltransferase [Bacillus sp. Au-Bac7]MCM3031532.1 uroporphyrinogen-III C-methyltransferase [Niallia sp. MER 6]
MKTNKGYVAFVGAGPGDIGLITAKGMECLRKADVVLYDRLANPRLLRFTKNDCVFIYCGKLPNHHIMRQEKINETLVRESLKGKYVVRLKGGDPSVFGRVGEEAEAIAKYNIPFEIVPGITASIAASIYAGIPVTHRDYSNSFTIRTGHRCKKNEGLTSLPKQEAAGETLAYYMGVQGLPDICEQLLLEGYASNTKAAVIEWGTLGKQRVVEGTLKTIVEKVTEANVKNPALTIVGDVVKLRSSIAWFEKKPFYQRKLLIAGDQEESILERHFTINGAEAYAFPALLTIPHSFSNEELQIVMEAERLIFASPEGIDILFSQLFKAGYDIRNLPRRIEHLSEKVREELQKRGVHSNKASFDRSKAVLIGDMQALTENTFSNNLLVIPSHHVDIDTRFDEINERLLTEDAWETVVFSNKRSIDLFLQEWNYYTKRDPKELSFAAIGQSVKKYALQMGFRRVDEKVQQELDKKEWMRDHEWTQLYTLDMAALSL